MNDEETMMASEVEELSEDMKRESDIENRKALGKTTLAFLDLETMSTPLRMVFVTLAIVLFGSIGVFFY